MGTKMGGERFCWGGFSPDSSGDWRRAASAGERRCAVSRRSGVRRQPEAGVPAVAGCKGVNSRWRNPGGVRAAIHPGQTAGDETHAAFPSQKGWGSGSPAPRPFRSGVYAVLAPRSGNGWRSIPAEPRRCAPLIVASRSKYTRYSSLTRLVSIPPSRALPAGREDWPHRENWASPASALTWVPPPAVRGYVVRPPAAGGAGVNTGVPWQRIISAGFALPRDAGLKGPTGRTAQRSRACGPR